MTLSLYFARRFLWVFIRVFLGFGLILLPIDLVEELRRFSGSGITMAHALALSALNLPDSLYRILPLIIFLAAIGFFLGLARTSELVVVRAAGRSALGFLAAPALTALILGALAVAVLNPLAAATQRRYDTLSAGEARGQVLSLADGALWLRQGTDQGQTVIDAPRADLDGTTLYNPTFLTFGPDGSPATRVAAEKAWLTPGAWVLSGAKRWALSDTNPERSATTLPEGSTIPTDLTAAKIRDGFGSPEGVSVWDLPAYIASLQGAGFSARSHIVWLQSELAFPLFLLTQVLIAAGFTMRHARAGRTGALVLMALLSGFAVYFLRDFARVLGQNGQVPVLAAAWTPPLAALFLSLALILHLEDG